MAWDDMIWYDVMWLWIWYDMTWTKNRTKFVGRLRERFPTSRTIGGTLMMRSSWDDIYPQINHQIKVKLIFMDLVPWNPLEFGWFWGGALGNRTKGPVQGSGRCKFAARSNRPGAEFSGEETMGFDQQIWGILGLFLQHFPLSKDDKSRGLARIKSNCERPLSNTDVWWTASDCFYWFLRIPKYRVNIFTISTMLGSKPCHCPINYA